MASTKAHQSASRLQWIMANIIDHPFGAALAVLFLVCIAFRIVTGVKFRNTISRNKASPGHTRVIPLLPYWIPWIGHGISFITGATTYLQKETKALGSEGSVFALSMGGSTHNIVTIPSIARQILFDRAAPIGMEAFITYILKSFWDDQGTLKAIDPTALWGEIHAVLFSLLRENFVSKAIKANLHAVQERTWDLVSGSRSWVDQATWERAGAVEIVSDGDSSGSKPFIAEAHLHHLLRDFVGDIASSILFGHEFMENNPNFLTDLWLMDSKFNLFLAGLPRWWPGMVGPYLARERIVQAVNEHHDALLRYLDGKDPGGRYSDLSDVSSVIVDRLKAFVKAGTKARGYSVGNAAVLWAMNINTNQIIFWLIWYIFSDAALLSEVRAEIAPYVKFVTPPDNGLPVKESPKLNIDVDALWNKCPLLKGAFFESMRLEAAGVSYKMIDQDFIVTESEEDARLLGKKSPDSYFMRKGELICIPHGVHQSDERYFRDPQRFDPRRFWSKPDAAEKQATPSDPDRPNADVKVDYGTMKVWGGGKHMCKGKTFAEREVVLFAAAIVMQWDMAPVTHGGKWVHPGRLPGTGAVRPKSEVKVRLWRRDAW